MIATALVMTVARATDQSFDVLFIPIAVVLFVLFNDWSSWWFHRGKRALGAGLIPQAIANFTRAIDASPRTRCVIIIGPLRCYKTARMRLLWKTSIAAQTWRLSPRCP
jgi:hypothetical protein